MIGQNPSFTVSEFVAIFNQSLEMMYPQIAVVGELSNFRVSKGKWVYFDLKDEHSSVKFFGTVFNLPGPLEDGITCEVVGRPRLHNNFGFSINVDSLRAVGEGSIRKAQDLLLKKLETEGLFAPERKRQLPYPPRRIGLITSAESAAIADFRKIMTARWPSLQIELIDTLVQGAQAPSAIVSAVHKFNSLSDPPEVLVVIRGGGSADDMAAFSEESVVRAVAASRIPTLIAIGHENDVSLAELAADMRASTPSNAAELLVPNAQHELEVVNQSKALLSTQLQRIIQDEQQQLVDQQTQFRESLQAVAQSSSQQLSHAEILLKALDPLLPLTLGYTLVRTTKGRHIKSARQLKASGADVFSLQFTDEKMQIRTVESE
ncbi:MAG: exodeoxyribonuclease VII large subunit [Candidatus Saccharimonadales bacterium]